jgi:hypothetical protein
MSYAERHTVIITTGSGGGVGYTQVVTGRIINVIYIKGDFADGVDIDISVESTGQTVWSQDDVNASSAVAPRQPTHSFDGAAALFADAGNPVLEPFVVADDRLKIEVSNGGNVKSGTFIVIVG